MNNLWAVARLIAVHPERKLVGRTRLQKTVKLLQDRGFPTTYVYRLHFYGPYSDGLQADMGFLRSLGLVVEEEPQSAHQPYSFRVPEDAEIPQVDLAKYDGLIGRLAQEEDPIVLELAATYETYLERNADVDDAVTRLQKNKRSKCTGGRIKKMFKLLTDLADLTPPD